MGKMPTAICSQPKSFFYFLIPNPREREPSPSSRQHLAFYFSMSYQELHKIFVCWSSHSPPISSGLGSELYPIHHHPTPSQRTNLILEPLRQHTDTSTRNQEHPFWRASNESPRSHWWLRFWRNAPKIHQRCCWCLKRTNTSQGEIVVAKKEIWVKSS